MSNLGRTPRKKSEAEAVKKQSPISEKGCRKMHGSSDLELESSAVKLMPKSPRVLKARRSNLDNQQHDINAMRKYRWIVVRQVIMRLRVALDPKILIAPQLQHRSEINQQSSTNALRKHRRIMTSKVKMWMAIGPTIPALPH